MLVFLENQRENEIESGGMQGIIGIVFPIKLMDMGSLSGTLFRTIRQYENTKWTPMSSKTY